MDFVRRLPIGAEVQPGGGTHFRVWAPNCRRVEVAVEHLHEQLHDGERLSQPHIEELRAEAYGYFSGLITRARAGSRYRFRLNGASQLFPDPA